MDDERERFRVLIDAVNSLTRVVTAMSESGGIDDLEAVREELDVVRNDLARAYELAEPPEGRRSRDW